MYKAKNILEQIVKSHSTSDIINPLTAVASILEFYENYKAAAEIINPDDDMLLFQYGTYDWGGKGRQFELNLTRQIIDANDEEYYQVKLTLYYKAADIGEIENYNLWSIDTESIKTWEETIVETNGFKRAAKVKPFDFKIELTKT